MILRLLPLSAPPPSYSIARARVSRSPTVVLSYYLKFELAHRLQVCDTLLTRLDTVDTLGLLVSNYCTGITVEKERPSREVQAEIRDLRPRSKGMIWKVGNLTTDYEHELFIYICTWCRLDVRLVSCRLK